MPSESISQTAAKVAAHQLGHFISIVNCFPVAFRHGLTLPAARLQVLPLSISLVEHKVGSRNSSQRMRHVLVTWCRRHLLQGCRDFPPVVRQVLAYAACWPRRRDVRRNLQQRSTHIAAEFRGVHTVSAAYRPAEQNALWQTRDVIAGTRVRYSSHGFDQQQCPPLCNRTNVLSSHTLRSRPDICSRQHDTVCCCAAGALPQCTPRNSGGGRVVIAGSMHQRQC